MFFRFVLVALGFGAVNKVNSVVNVCHGTWGEIFVPALVVLEPLAYLVLASLLSKAAFSLLVVPAVEQIPVPKVMLIQPLG